MQVFMYCQIWSARNFGSGPNFQKNWSGWANISWIKWSISGINGPQNYYWTTCPKSVRERMESDIVDDLSNDLSTSKYPEVSDTKKALKFVISTNGELMYKQKLKVKVRIHVVLLFLELREKREWNHFN